MGEPRVTVQGVWAVFGVGCSGGVLAELARWYSLREAVRWPDYSRRARYWVVTALMMMAGGGLAVLYGVTQPQSAVLIANVGASAPLIIKALASVAPPAAPNTTPEFAPADGKTVVDGWHGLIDFIAGR